MEHVLRPAIKGFDYPSLREHFSTEQQKSFTSLDEATRIKHVRAVKDRIEVTNSLKKFEVNNQELFKEALQKKIIRGDKIREYVEAKSHRETLNNTKGGKALVVEDITLDRLGKKKLVPVHLAKYY